MSGFNEYAAGVAADMRAGAGQVASSAAADIGDSYQEILMSNASISPPDGLASTTGLIPEAGTGPSVVDASYTDVTPAESLALPPPEIDIA